MTLTVGELRAQLAEHGLSPRHALGQHFVADPNTVRRIARLAGVGPGDRVVEIGAGPGVLTLALAETGASVLAVEIDRALEPLLRANVEPAGARVVIGDAMEADWGHLLGDGPWHLVANLPYNVGTPLLADLLDEVPAIDHFLVMVQREVAHRLVAGPGDPARGALSVKVEHHATGRIVGSVPRTVFLPPPEVESSLVELRRRERPLVTAVTDEQLFSVVRQAFGQRRKMLRRSLAGRVDPDGFAAAGVDPTARPAELSTEAWGRLAEVAR